MIESAIVAILRAHAGVGAIAADRIYLMESIQGADATFCIVSSVGGDADQSHDGPTGTKYRTIQVSCISSDIGTAKLLAAQVKAALHGYRGVVAGVTIFYADAGNEVDISDPDYGNQVALDFDTSFSEA